MRVTGTTARFKIRKPTLGIPAWAFKNGIYTTNDPAVKARLRRLPGSHAEEVTEETNQPSSEVVAPMAVPIEELHWYKLRELGAKEGVLKHKMKKSELIAALMKVYSRE